MSADTTTTNNSNSITQVKVGQVWRDLDKRKTEERLIRIISVSAEYAHVRNKQNRLSRIHLSRFKAGATGYALVSEATGAEESEHVKHGIV